MVKGLMKLPTFFLIKIVIAIFKTLLKLLFIFLK